MGTTAEPLQLRKNRRGSRLNRSHVAISDIILGAVCTKGLTLYVSLNSIHVPARAWTLLYITRADLHAIDARE